MGQPTYYYNPETCQYEPAKLRWTAMITYGLLLVVASAVLWACILLLYGKIFPSERAKYLKKENTALASYYAGVESELTASKQLLTQIDAEERQLYQKLFSEDEVINQEASTDNSSLKHALTSGKKTEYERAFSAVSEKFNGLKARSINSSIYYGEKLTISDADVKFMLSLPSLLPVALEQVTNISGFGHRVNPFHKGTYLHPGADFVAARGTDVVASGNGKVVHISRSSIQAGYGNYIEIDHGNEIVTLYAHLDEINVRMGQRIQKGEKIGTVGSSGGSIAPHLHFEIFREGEQVNPVPYLMQGLSSTAFAKLIEDSKKKNQALD